MAAATATGVLLVNLGTPDAPTPGAVRRYLREFLLDPRVVRIPKLVWWPILEFVVLRVRPAKSAAKYAKIWTRDGSPLRFYTERQAQLLRGYLGERLKVALPVAAGMRYGNPSIAGGLRSLTELGCQRILVLPLYPQYAQSTTASTQDVLDRLVPRIKPRPELRVLHDFHDHRAYVKAIAKSVNDYWFKHGRPDRLVMSFHGLPKVVVERGDPYETQCRESARLIATELGWNDARAVVTFQSRFGAQKWLEPATDATLRALGGQGVGRVDVICPGFTSDCLETLEEIAIEGRDTFRRAGGKDFHYIPTTNDLGPWMTALSIIAIENLEGWVERAPEKKKEIY